MLIKSTIDVPLPSSPLDFVIGQDEAVLVAKIVASQRRNLLLIGPPGTGKSMVAQAISSILPKPKEEISVAHNSERPERPVVVVRGEKEMGKGRKGGKVLSPASAPAFVSEKLGFRCRECGVLSGSEVSACPSCGADKYRERRTKFDDFLFDFDVPVREERVYSTRVKGGKEETVVFERDGSRIRVVGKEQLEKEKELRKVIVPLNRDTFVQATGASETELLGDVKHDPYGSHPKLGSLPYTRVVPGAIHEAHEGVLFIDEISSLGNLQRYILTAMQEKKFPIVGRNPSGEGASVKVDNVPCDFILVASANMNDIGSILPPLRSRIVGNGYEVLLSTHMKDSKENREKIVQFIAQEIKKDKRIPHANMEAVKLIVEEARKMAKEIDNVDGLTLRFRGLSGIIKLAGDRAAIEGSKLIGAKHVKEAIKRGKSIEEQMSEKYGSLWKAGMSDYGIRKKGGEEKDVG
jgi:ATP-dependent Lon protease